MPLKKRPLNRDSGRLRDAGLIVIASEDTYAVAQYFARFRTRRLQFVVLPTEDCCSSPQHVVNRLEQFRQETATEEYDQFWICLDSDHWANENHIQNLHAVVAHCFQRKYGVAISNPCVELWTLLHFEDPNPEWIRSSDSLDARLKQIAGGYNKTKCCGTLPFTSEKVADAIRRAKAMDENDEPIPKHLVTRMYRILEMLLEKELIDLT